MNTLEQRHTSNSKPVAVTQIEPDGPYGTGLCEWERMDPAALESGNPIQRGHLYDEHDADGYLAGVWDCTAFDDKPGPYTVDEYMLLLEGRVIMAMPDGTEITIDAGEAFVIPKGLECQWKMPGYVRKIFMILDGNPLSGSSNPSLFRITKPTLGNLSAPSPSAITQTETCFVNADGRMSVKRHDFVQALTGPVSTGARRLVSVLDGSVEIGGKRFSAGESFYLSSCVDASWSITAGSRLIEARFQG